MTNENDISLAWARQSGNAFVQQRMADLNALGAEARD